MRIGYFAWAPGLQSAMRTSAGNSRWLQYLMTSYKHAGYEVMWLVDEPNPQDTIKLGDVETCEALVFNWRWEMLDYPERNQLYITQMKLINKFGGKKRIVVHDQDHMISTTDFNLLKSYGAIMTAPELEPKPGFKSLYFPNPFVGGYSRKAKMPFMTEDEIAYIGNVYGRYSDAIRFLEGAAKKVRVRVWGNWLEDGSDRPGAEQVKKDMPHVIFRGRLSEAAVLEVLVTATATIHLHKPSYGPVGFLTMRWLEAASAYTMAFIPSTFFMPKYISEKFGKVVVADGEQMANVYRDLTEAEWESIAESQRSFIFGLSNVEQWFNIVEG